MIIEFELQGSRFIHKGIFDTTGFWVKYENDTSDVCVSRDPVTDAPNYESIEYGFKLYSHFSFSFYHENKEVVDLVYSRLISILRGTQSIDIDGIGYFRRLNK